VIIGAKFTRRNTTGAVRVAAERRRIIMHVLAAYLVAAALSISTPTLVLTDGHRIPVDGAVQMENGRATFHSNGGLFSIPANEVDLDATRAAAASPVITVRPDEKKPLKLNEEARKKLIADIENNHSGKAAPAEAISVATPINGEARAEKDAKAAEEWRWRQDARSHEQAVRDAQDNVNLLRDEIEKLKSQVTGFVALGYDSHQFTYQTSRIVHLEEQLPYAEKELARAQRLNDEFREDARKQGILPGWLR
jgi:hypothetical protein